MITFKNRVANKDKLLSFGFKMAGGVYEFNTNLAQNQLSLNVVIYPSGEVYTRVTDNEFGEEYTLHLVESAVGSFVGTVRDEYITVLKSIEENCFDLTYQKHPQEGKILEGVYEKYGISPEYPFEGDGETAVLRRKDNKKWFAIIMHIGLHKLSLHTNESGSVMNFKIDPKELDQIVDSNKYFRAYHMNKKMWATVVLDGRLPTEEILRRIDESYRLTGKKQ